MRVGAFICLSLACLVSLVGAQDFTLRYFDLRELAHTPGVVKLSPDYQTIIEFEELSVERVSSGRGDLMVVEVSDNTIRLRANQYLINTDLTVTAGGKTALFRLEGEVGTSAPRIYSVRTATPAKRSRQGPPGTSDAASDAASDAEAERAAAEKTSTPPLGSTAEAAPAGTEFRAVVYHSGSELSVQYILTNTGSDTLLADPNRLQVSYGSVNLPYTLTRVPTTSGPDNLAGGASDYGTLVIENAPQDTDDITLKWTFFREGSGQHFTLTRTLEAIPIGLPQSSPSEP